MITKAILTGGGRATRLRPITSTINKHLICLAGKPMIFWAIEKVVKAGVKEIFINTNPGETELQKVVGDGSRWGIKIKFFEQQGGPQGIAHVVKQAQQFIGVDPFMFYLSDNIVLGDLNNLADKFSSGKYDCMLTLSKVNDPERFGVPVFDKQGTLVDVWEKPSNPPNNFAVTGIYLYGPKLFFDAFEHIEKSARGEYEISSIHSYLLKNNFKVGYEEITGWWKDTGKPEDLLLANQLLLETMDEKEFNRPNKAQVGAQAKILDKVKLIGPVIIGDNCVLKNCVIGPNAVLGNGCEVDGPAISNSLLFEECKITGDLKISDSILGRGVKVTGNGERQLILGENSVIR